MIRTLPVLSFRCGFPTFVAAFTLANLLLFGWPLYAFAMSTTRATSWAGWTDLLVLTGVQVILMVMLLALVSLFSLKATKAACIALLVANALALYFITTYHVLLD
jgi:lipid A ethanolaminephosphotransferase